MLSQACGRIKRCTRRPRPSAQVPWPPPCRLFCDVALSPLMQLDREHPTVGIFQELLPRAQVSGGSFAHWLPHPSQIPKGLRIGTLRKQQRLATNECIGNLLEQLAFPRNFRVPRAPGGYLQWPPGIVGSISHKGTLVLGAAARARTYEALGIDIERAGGRGHALSASMIAPEGLPPGRPPDLATLIAFSAKEAAFKAIYPLQRQPLQFGDVRLTWELVSDKRLRARATRKGFRDLRVDCAFSDQWIVCAAIPWRPLRRA